MKKTIKCPKCKKEIEELKHWEKIDSISFCNLEGGELNYYGQEQIYDNAIDLEWCCPECLKTLFITEDEAIKFLKGIKLK